MRGRYDGVASIEMFEAVGEKYWPAYFATVRRALEPGGRACVQTITIADARFERYRTQSDFIQQYIFPGGMLASPSRFVAEAARGGFESIARARGLPRLCGNARALARGVRRQRRRGSRAGLRRALHPLLAVLSRLLHRGLRERVHRCRAVHAGRAADGDGHAAAVARSIRRCRLARSCRVWVIGASTGIGAAIAQALLEGGRARRAVGAIGGQAREVAGAAAIAQRAGADRAARLHAGRRRGRRRGTRVRAAWNGCDLVLVVAGTHKEIRAWDLTEADADALLEINLNGPIATIAAVLPALLAQGHGAIGVFVVGRRLRRPAEGAGLRRLEGGAHQLHRDALPRPPREGARRLPDQPGLREDAAHRHATSSGCLR